MSKKKDMSEGLEVKDTMIFERSDRKKAGEDGAAPKKPKPKAKTALAVFIAAVVLFVGVPWIVVTVVDSPAESIANDGQPRHTFEQLLESTEATDKSAELFALKNPELRDSAAVEALVSYLQIDRELGSFAVEVQAETKPYSITLKFDLSHDVPDDGHDMWEQTMIKYSCAILSLVDNIAQVNWEFPKADGGVGGAYFTRADAEKLYNLGVTATRFAADAQSVQLMLNQLGIDLY